MSYRIYASNYREWELYVSQLEAQEEEAASLVGRLNVQIVQHNADIVQANTLSTRADTLVAASRDLQLHAKQQNEHGSFMRPELQERGNKLHSFVVKLETMQDSLPAFTAPIHSPLSYGAAYNNLLSLRPLQAAPSMTEGIVELGELCAWRLLIVALEIDMNR